MNLSFQGSWRSVRSTIPDFVAGKEWLHFTDGEFHVWEVAQRSGKGAPVLTRFILEEEGAIFHMRPISRSTGIPGRPGWTIKIELISSTELAVTPQHGFTTIFNHEEKPA